MTISAIARLWFPLFTSWLLMTFEGPLVTAFINRMENPSENLAAFSLVLAIAIFIEAPIISILSTATALIRDRSSYYKVRNFNYILTFVLTVIMIGVSCTPAADYLLEGILKTPEAAASRVKTGLCILIFWTAAIAYRRFLQGILISTGNTGKIAAGTILRLIFTGGTAGFLMQFSDLTGIEAAAWGLMSGVTAEALYTGLAVLPHKAEIKSRKLPITADQISYLSLWNFHAPLALTSMIMLTSQPIINALLIRSEEPLLNLASWPVIFQLILVSRAGAMAYPEVVISVYSEQDKAVIKRFAFILSLGFTTLLGVLIFSPLLDFYLTRIQSVPEAVHNQVSSFLYLFLPLPLVSGFSLWLRGVLIKKKFTRAVNLATVVNVSILVGSLFILHSFRIDGLKAAAFSMVLSAGAEILTLQYFHSLVKED